MALSNIFNEPRREITESIVGTLVFLVPLWLDYRFALWFNVVTNEGRGGCPWPLGMLLGLLFGIIALFIGAGLFYLPHFIGEVVCDFFDNRGLELRPKKRRRG